MNDFRYTLRQLRARPLFTVMAVLTLGLGIGITTLVFTFVDHVLLRPLPFPASERLLVLWERNDSENFPRMVVSPPNFDAWRRQARSFESVAAYTPGTATLDQSEPEQISAVRVSSGMLRTLGLRPIAGRDFDEADDREGADRVALVSETLVRRSFAGRQLVGETIRLNGEPVEIIGILPRAAFPPAVALEGDAHFEPAEVWTPLRIDYAAGQRGAHYLTVLGRLRRGVDASAAQVELAGIARNIERDDPEYADWTARVVRLSDEITQHVRKPLLVLLAASFLVLLIACANIANLLLARGLRRQREIAIRLALGSGRARLVRLAAVESLTLSLIGAVAGIAFAAVTLRVLSATRLPMLPRFDEVTLDGRLIVCALALGGLIGVTLAAAPALPFLRASIQLRLREAAGSVKAGRLAGVQRYLVVAEVALSVALLATAILLARSFQRLSSVDPGFRTRGMVAFDVALAAPDYDDSAARIRFATGVLENLRRLPGVREATLITDAPIEGDRQGTSFTIEGWSPQPGAEPQTNFTFTAANYFTVAGLPLLAGRTFEDRGAEPGSAGVVVNEAFVQKYLPGTSAVGRRIALGFSTQTMRTIVGVVSNERFLGLDREAGPNVYLPYGQTGRSRLVTFVARARQPNPLSLTQGLRTSVRSVDPRIAVTRIRTVEDVVATSLAQPRLSTATLVLFATLALLLSALGLYAVISYAVSQRVPEIGVRLALGASPSSISALVLRDGVLIAGLGVAVGLPAAFALARLSRSMLYEIGSGDLGTYTAVVALLFIIACLAAWLPARRASRVDPLVALRAE